MCALYPSRERPEASGRLGESTLFEGNQRRADSSAADSGRGLRLKDPADWPGRFWSIRRGFHPSNGPGTRPIARAARADRGAEPGTRHMRRRGRLRPRVSSPYPALDSTPLARPTSRDVWPGNPVCRRANLPSAPAGEIPLCDLELHPRRAVSRDTDERR
jgi:hypothetical protein